MSDRVLDGRVAVVCGGAGEVGEGIVAGLLAAGARVAVPSRSNERLEGLAASLRENGFSTEGLVPVVGDLSAGGDEARAFARQIASEAGMPHLVVAALGGWDSGPPLADIPIPDWERTVADGLRSHQLAVHAFVPLLRSVPGASYVMLNGAAARYPVPGSGAVSAVAAGELMMAQVLAAEEAGHDVQVEAYVLGPIGTRSRGNTAVWMADAVQIGEIIALRASRRLAPDGPPAGPATIIEILGAPDLRRARDLPVGGVRGSLMGRAGWMLWGMQTGGLSKSIRRGRPPYGY